MKVYAYPRVSTDEQVVKGGSLSEQQERLTAYCTAMGWDAPIFFVEEGFSGKNINRPMLTAMLEEIKNNPEGGIVMTTKLDRLSRKLFDILSLNEFFNKYNYNYVSATEGFDTSTPSGRLVLQMLGMVAEFERERISERVKENMMSLARSGSKLIMRPCFGYDAVDGNLVVNVEESLIVKKMVGWALKGEGPRAIAGRLNSETNAKTKEGNEWHDKVIRELLLRETLVGDFVYNKTYKKGTKVIKRPESEWIIIRDHFPSLMSREDQQKLREIFEGRKKVGKHVSDDTYLLSGLVWCGNCGEKMNGKTNKNYSKSANGINVHYTYLCNGYLKKKKCFHHYVKRDDIENLIINDIRNIAVSSNRKVVPELSKPSNEEIDKSVILAKLEKLDKKMQKQIDAYDEDLITKYDLKAATQKISEEREKLRKILEEDNVESDNRRIEKLRKRAEKQKDNLLSEDRVAVKQLIRTFIHSITVLNGEEISIIYQQN